jgi:alanyl-tRNA synthetase
MDFDERGYLSDPYREDFTATVKKASKSSDGNYAVYLDRTFFYPVSGGQPDDRGTIGERKVLEVKETDQGVCHIVDGELEKGGEYGAHVDFSRRLDFMQQHSGQHLLSRIFLEKLNAPTVGFHLGECSSTIDLDTTRPLVEQLREIEEEANMWIYRDVEIRSYVMNEKDYQEMIRERDRTVRARLPGEMEVVRIVEIDGLDTTACCGTHCRSTGEIGVIKISGIEKAKDKVRVMFLCGLRAWKDYCLKHSMLKEIAFSFSTEWKELGKVVEKVREENKKMEKTNKALLVELAHCRSDTLKSEAIELGDYKLIRKVYKKSSADVLRNIAIRLQSKGGYIVLLSAREPKPALVFASSKDIPVNMGEALKACSAVMEASGGGGNDFAQGGGGIAGKIDEALESAETFIREKLQ